VDDRSNQDLNGLQRNGVDGNFRQRGKEVTTQRKMLVRVFLSNLNTIIKKVEIPDK
jgi:hypothetical protein